MKPAWKYFGGQKFKVALIGLGLLACSHPLHLEQAQCVAIASIVGAFVAVQAVADGWTNGATSTVANSKGTT